MRATYSTTWWRINFAETWSNLILNASGLIFFIWTWSFICVLHLVLQSNELLQGRHSICWWGEALFRILTDHAIMCVSWAHTIFYRPTIWHCIIDLHQWGLLLVFIIFNLIKFESLVLITIDLAMSIEYKLIPCLNSGSSHPWWRLVCILHIRI